MIDFRDHHVSMLLGTYRRLSAMCVGCIALVLITTGTFVPTSTVRLQRTHTLMNYTSSGFRLEL